jgi:type IV secretion system protein VirB4
VSAAPFYTQLPWSFITSLHEGVVVQKDGILQRSFAYRAPDLDSASPFYINDIAVRFNDAVKRLDAGWAVQFEAQRFFTRDYPGAVFDRLAPYLIDKERERAFRRIGKHFESSYFFTFIYRPPSENIKKLTTMFIQNGGGSERSIRESVAFFVQETDNIASILQTKMMIEALNNEQTLAFLHSSVSTSRHYIKFPHNSIMLDRILPDQELTTSLTMKLGDSFIPIIGVNDFPEETYPAILDSLDKERLEYRWVTRFICAGKEAGKKETLKKEKAHRGNRTTFLQTFLASTANEEARTTNHGASVKEADAVEANMEIETDAVALGFYTSNVMVWDRSLSEAKKKADTVKTVINSAGFTCKEETFNALEAFKSMMPGQIYANYRALPVVTSNLAHVVPLSSIWPGMARNAHAGHVTGCDAPHAVCATESGTPFFLNINPSDVGHAAVWGPTGAGKSTLLNFLEMQFLKYPRSNVIVFDKGRSCRQPCMAAGGLFYEPAGENGSGVNFQPLRDLETERDLSFAVEFMELLVSLQGYNVSPFMSNAVKTTVSLMAGIEKEARTISSFVHYCSDFNDPENGRNTLKEYLAPYCLEGKYGRVFDADSVSVSLDSRFIVFEMEYLMNMGEACVTPALEYLFYFVEKKFTGDLTMLVLDEAWLFLKHPSFQDKIAEWLKTLRKKNVFVVFATQDVADAVNSPLKTTIIQQCLTKIYLADPTASTNVMAAAYRAFGLSDDEIECIAGARMKKDYYYTSPLGSRLFQLDLGPLTLAIIGTANHAALDALLKKHPEKGYEFCADILRLKKIPYGSLMSERDARRLAARNVPPRAKPEVTGNVPRAKAAVTGNAPQGAAARGNAPEVAGNAPARVFRLSQAEILNLAAANDKDGAGRWAELMARRYGTGKDTWYKARAVLKSASPDDIEAVRNDSVSINAVYKKYRKPKLTAV